MVRHTIATIGILLLAAALLPVAPAQAQFDSIFGNNNSNNNPPRPPADVPPPPQQPYYPRQPDPQQQPAYPPAAQQRAYPDYRNYPAAQVQPVQQPQPLQPAAGRDQPPAQPMPAPMSLPPSARPGGGTIESQPLAPPPGTEPDQQANTPKQAQPANPNAPAAPQQPGATEQANQPPAGQQPAAAPPEPGKAPTREVVVEPPPQRISNPTAVFEGLDKITGRITSFDVAINETVQFGALQVTPKACYSRPPTETPQTDAFVDVDEVTLTGKIQRIFTGWMFKASPGLHAVEHPIYDVWLTDCKGGKNPDVADASDNAGDDQAAAAPANDAKPDKPAARQQAAPQRAPAPRQRPSAQSRSFLPAIR